MALASGATLTAYASSLPRLPREGLLKLWCKGHIDRSNELTEFDVRLGSRNSEGTSWAYIKEQTYRVQETATSFIIAGKYRDRPDPKDRYVIDITTGHYAAYAFGANGETRTHSSLPSDPGCIEIKEKA